MKKKEIIAGITIVIITGVILLFLFENTPQEENKIPQRTKIDYSSIKENDTYIITIINIIYGSEFAPNKDEHFKIGEMSCVLWREGNLVVWVQLIDILNNETSNLTYYDIDENGRVSIGDKFMIKGNFTEECNIFSLHRKYGASAGDELYFKGV